MIGRTLEAIIKEHTKNKMSIFNGLENLKKKGIISDEIFQWGDELRILRNLGVHAKEANLTHSDLTEAMDFLQAIIKFLYHLRPRFKDMKERTKKVN